MRSSAHKPGLVVFDEGHLLVSSNLVDADKDEDTGEEAYKPRMEELRYLISKFDEDTRVVVCDRNTRSG